MFLNAVSKQLAQYAQIDRSVAHVKFQHGFIGDSDARMSDKNIASNLNRMLQMRLLFVGRLTSQQHASVSQGRICSDNFTCCHTEIEVADPTFHPTQSQYTDTGPSSPSTTDPISPGAWQGSHWSATGMTRPRKNPVASGILTRDLPLSRRTP